MLSRRELLQIGAASAAIAGGLGGLSPRAFAQQRLTAGGVAAVRPARQCHAAAYRRPACAARAGAVPRAVAQSRRRRSQGRAAAYHRPRVPRRAIGIAEKSAAAYALTSEDFEALAKSYGRIGGLDRMATAVKAVRAQRGERVLLLDGGDTWQGTLGAYRTKGQDVVDCLKLLAPDAMTGHWEFTYGEARVKAADRAARLCLPRAQRARHRMAGAGVRRPTRFSRRAA